MHFINIWYIFCLYKQILSVLYHKSPILLWLKTCKMWYLRIYFWKKKKMVFWFKQRRGKLHDCSEDYTLHWFHSDTGDGPHRSWGLWSGCNLVHKPEQQAVCGPLTPVPRNRSADLRKQRALRLSGEPLHPPSWRDGLFSRGNLSLRTLYGYRHRI